MGASPPFSLQTTPPTPHPGAQVPGGSRGFIYLPVCWARQLPSALRCVAEVRSGCGSQQGATPVTHHAVRHNHGEHPAPKQPLRLTPPTGKWRRPRSHAAQRGRRRRENRVSFTCYVHAGNHHESSLFAKQSSRGFYPCHHSARRAQKIPTALCPYSPTTSISPHGFIIR